MVLTEARMAEVPLIAVLIPSGPAMVGARLLEAGHVEDPRYPEAGCSSQHGAEQRDMIADCLVGEPFVVHLEIDVAVDLLDSKVAQFQGAKRGAEMLTDDALVVLLAPLALGAVLEPVVAEVTEGLLRWRCIPDAAPDLFGFDLALAELDLGALVVVEDGALALASVVEPADAPLAPCLVGLATAVSLLRARAPVSCSADAGRCRSAGCGGRRLRGPRVAQKRKTRGQRLKANLAFWFRLRGGATRLSCPEISGTCGGVGAVRGGDRDWVAVVDDWRSGWPRPTRS